MLHNYSSQMIKNLISEKIFQKLGHSPTISQKTLIHSLSEFINEPVNRSLFIIRGYAGTGKTSVISALVKTLDEFTLKSVLLAPTGKAAKVLAHYSGKPAFTIHKKIFRQSSSKDGFGKFELEKNLYTNTVFIVDEASMISNELADNSIFGSGRLLDDLLDYVYNGKGCKLIISGDTAQLPPVGNMYSPALGKNFYTGSFVKVYECELTEVVRQEQASGILENATYLREIIGYTNAQLPKFNILGYQDISRITGNELIDQLEKSYAEVGTEETIIINRSNKRSNMYNAGVRSKILYREDELVSGDLLMVVKNNYYWLQEQHDVNYIANGDMLEIVRIKKYEENYGLRFADVTLKLLDYNLMLDAKIMLDTLKAESASLTSEQNKDFFYKIYEDFADLTPKRKGYTKVKEDPYFNALQIKFAYAVTCHKAQGGQWQHVFIDQGYISDDMINIDYLRWLYTAITRATKKVFLVNFPDKYFG